MGRNPNNLEMILLRQKAGQQLKDSSKIINFPASSSATYHILLFTTAGSNTEFSAIAKAGGKQIFHKTIDQVGNSVLSLRPEAVTVSEGLKTLPATEATSSATATESTVVSVDWTIENLETDANGFGLRLLRQPVDTDFFYAAADTVDGAISSATEVKLDDLTNIVEGMVITGVSAGSLSGTPKITAINTAEKTLTLSVAQTFADGIILSFQARGASVIQRAVGVGLTIGTFTATQTALTKTVRTNPSGTTVNLNGTYGIAGGGHVSVKGFGVNNATANTVQSVTASSSAGSMVVSLDQTGITTGTILKFSGSTRIITIKGDITINQHPGSTTIVGLNLDNFIALGAAS